MWFSLLPQYTPITPFCSFVISRILLRHFASVATPILPTSRLRTRTMCMAIFQTLHLLREGHTLRLWSHHPPRFHLQTCGQRRPPRFHLLTLGLRIHSRPTCPHSRPQPHFHRSQPRSPAVLCLLLETGRQTLSRPPPLFRHREWLLTTLLQTSSHPPRFPVGTLPARSSVAVMLQSLPSTNADRAFSGCTPPMVPRLVTVAATSLVPPTPPQPHHSWRPTMEATESSSSKSMRLRGSLLCFLFK
jgi:hypothetical protein